MSANLRDYASIAEKVRNASSLVRPELRDAYFAAIVYPVCAAEAQARKMLWAQKARAMASHYPLAAWQDSTASLCRAVAESQHAYRQISELTATYNQTMAGGKWNHSMSMRPRDLPVFAAPSLPFLLSDKEVEQWIGQQNDNARSARSHPAVSDGAIAFNASEWQNASEGVHTVQMLGHSMNAVAMGKGTDVEYRFQTSRDSGAVLRIALIPTQPNDDGDLRFSVSVDGSTPTVYSLKEPFRSNQWKQNVLRRQAIRTLPLPGLKAGEHTIVVKALDPHIILDQLMIDFNPRRRFYLFPAETATTSHGD